MFREHLPYSYWEPISWSILGQNLPQNFILFVSKQKIEIYDTTYLRIVNRCMCKTLYTLLAKGGLSRVLILKLQLQASDN
jgi:hypothetical protein